MNKLDYINQQAKRHTIKQGIYNMAQCAIVGFLFTMPAWVYLLD